MYIWVAETTGTLSCRRNLKPRLNSFPQYHHLISSAKPFKKCIDVKWITGSNIRIYGQWAGALE